MDAAASSGMDIVALKRLDILHLENLNAGISNVVNCCRKHAAGTGSVVLQKNTQHLKYEMREEVHFYRS